MARIFITGSADGLGRLTAETLLGDGYEVIVHARSADRLTAVARLWPGVLSNAVDPGWVPTSGGYWYHRSRRDPHPAARDEAFQDSLLKALESRTGTPLP